MGHPKAFELATRLRDMAPEPFEHCVLHQLRVRGRRHRAEDFSALAYQRAIGQGTRTRLIGRERGYHGVGFGGISVGGIVNNRKFFGTLLNGVDHLPHTHLPAQNAFSRGQPEAWRASGRRAGADRGAARPETIAAVIVEPMAGSTGVLMPPKVYLEKLRSICTRHGILLIFDEVITGFGRLGSPFAADHFGVMPDMITCAKGLTNGGDPDGGRAGHEGDPRGPSCKAPST